jgi:hypothetical protein
VHDDRDIFQGRIDELPAIPSDLGREPVRPVGVELGKVLANRIVPELEAAAEPDLDHHDPSTAALIRHYRANRRG